ncbi:MAG TPA: hypothetical protein DDW49_03775 [Deltaproteobacteria bacterium]|nr:hypothetical protein [Deltaproteobacteria bacterium]
MTNKDHLKQKFFGRSDISDINKNHVKNFFKGYNCAETSERKFYSWLPYVLIQTNDIKRTMNDEAEMVDIFDKLHAKLKPSGYKTSLDVCRTFCRRLNNDILPATFKRVKALTQKEKTQLCRVNRKDYKTFSWVDAENIAALTNSVQLKAMVLCQLEGGLRPAELEALDIGDVVQDGKFFVVTIHESKNAKPRKIILYHSAPMLNRWLQMHPLKQDTKNPLWIMENTKQSSTFRSGDADVRYKYDAIRQTMRRMAKRAGFKNGMSLYMMRHSSVALKKKERMPLDVAAEMMGHNINFYINTYGRLTDEEKIDRVKGHYGEKTPGKDEKEASLLCSICQTINEPHRELCEKCSQPLTLTAAMKHDKSAELQEQLTAMQEQINLLIKTTYEQEILDKARMRKTGRTNNEYKQKLH